MKRLTLGALALLLTGQLATAATLTITKPWTTVRAKPSAGAPAMALAFGNDTLPVVQRSGTWLAVRLGGKRLGWVAAADAALAGAARSPSPPDAPLPAPPSVTALEQPPGGVGNALNPPGITLVKARGLQSRGKTEAAREALVEVLLRAPDDASFYEAVRRMSYYYPIGEFAPQRGTVPPRAMARAREALPAVLLHEGRVRLAAQDYLAAAAVLEPAVLGDGPAGTLREAEAVLRASLTAYLGSDAHQHDPRERALAESMLHLYFPTDAAPPATGPVAQRK